MEIRNQGRGIHAREIPGLEKFRSLPRQWYAFTNLEMTIGPGQSREIDLVMVIEDRILLVDLKDWNGLITSDDGRWWHNGRDMGPSPVGKIRENARKVAEVLKAHLKDRARAAASAPKLLCPFFQGIVVQSGRGTLDQIAANEKSSAFTLDDFVRFAGDPKLRRQRLGEPLFSDAHNPLTTRDSSWRHVLERFFNASGGHFRPGQRRYASYRATSDHPTFVHRSGVFTEFDVEDENAGRAGGLLRRWDFSKAETRFQTEAGRGEIAGRERHVIAYLNDRNPETEMLVLQPRIEDVERSVGYWEIFDKRRRLKRLSDFVLTETRHLSRATRIELSRQLLARVKAIHDLDAAHLDLGPHSVWLEAPSSVRLSHLLAAKVPEVRSLGEHRYQFLSTVTAPEDVLGGSSDSKKKDCFLLGAAIHQLIFDQPPKERQTGEPPEWDEGVDANGAFQELHSWFRNALTWNMQSRFTDAGAMLEAFNLAVAESPSSREVLEGLERFRHWKSQRQIFLDLPSVEDLKSDDRVEVWRSHYEGRSVVVKMWKREAWGDQNTEAPRLLAFLEKAEGLRLSPPTGCAAIRKVSWLPDAILLLQDSVDAPSLEEVLLQKPELLTSVHIAAVFVKQLAERIVALHQTGMAHGDLKPSNILVDQDPEPVPVLVDILDLAPASDGEIISTAYAPPSGGDRFARDRFSVTKIAEEVFAACELEASQAAVLAQAIQKCTIGPPENATLLPLIEAIESVLNPPIETARPVLQLSIRGAETGPLLHDEGVFGLRIAPDQPILFIRGSSEEIGIRLNDEAHPVSGWRKAIEQKRISAVSRHEFVRLEVDVEIKSASLNDFSQLAMVTDTAVFRDAWKSRRQQPASAVDKEYEVAEESVPEGDEAEDALAEAIVAEHPHAAVDVPLMWRSLMTAEEDLSIEGSTAGESNYQIDRRRHFAAFDLEEGTFDFSREDTVLVERLDRKGMWRELGIFDVSLSNPGLVAVDASRRFPDARDRLIADGTRLRFRSHFETTSRTRREAATSRILSRQAAVRELIDICDSRTGRTPSLHPEKVDAKQIKDLYSLNNTQAKAFARLVSIRPVGLLQGPPGTGKTFFIGVLVHFALTTGLARNVLLASQSHEAVNNAAEAVLRLFNPADGRPSIVRVGQEGSVSERLLPYHSGRVEMAYKDRFRASFKERMRIVGPALGLPHPVCDQLIYIDQTVRHVIERIESLRRSDTAEASEERIDSLWLTVRRMIERLEIPSPETDGEIDGDILASIVEAVASRHGIVNADLIARFRTVSRLASDFIGSVSTQERSFETFLAGTRQIVAGTCVGLGRSSLGLTTTPFDLVVVDEAARCTASELAVPMQSGRWIVLVGDQAQLEPMHRTEVIEVVAANTQIPKREIKRSDFERVFTSSYGTEAGCQLTQQYRMLAPIGRIVSASFYSQALNSRTLGAKDQPRRLAGWAGKDGLLDLDRQQWRQGFSAAAGWKFEPNQLGGSRYYR